MSGNPNLNPHTFIVREVGPEEADRLSQLSKGQLYQENLSLIHQTLVRLDFHIFRVGEAITDEARLNQPPSVGLITLLAEKQKEKVEWEAIQAQIKLEYADYLRECRVAARAAREQRQEQALVQRERREGIQPNSWEIVLEKRKDNQKD